MIHFSRSISALIVFSFYTIIGYAQKIDRKELVQRHNIIVTKVDSLSSLTVGNGKFAYTVDVTGLQTFPEAYKKGISLGTQSEWGWHSFIDTSDFKRTETYKTYHLNGRDIPYTVQWNSPERNKDAANWFRLNPHRLQLGLLGLDLIKRNGQPATVNDITDIRQELDLWTGQIKSHFTLEGVSVDVITCCHSQLDVIGASVQSPLIKEGRLKIKLRFPYPTGDWTDEGANWKNPDRHHSWITDKTDKGVLIEHQLDKDRYFVDMRWSGSGATDEKEAHYFVITPGKDREQFSFSIKFSLFEKASYVDPFEKVLQNSVTAWQKFWNSGGVIDFNGST